MASGMLHIAGRVPGDPVRGIQPSDVGDQVRRMLDYQAAIARVAGQHSSKQSGMSLTGDKWHQITVVDEEYEVVSIISTYF